MEIRPSYKMIILFEFLNASKFGHKVKPSITDETKRNKIKQNFKTVKCY